MAAPTLAAISLLEQTRGLPAEFAEYFFDAPLAAKIELNNQLLSEALVTLSRDDRVSLLELTDSSSSSQPAEERQRWADFLRLGVPLGICERNCPYQLLAVHYSLETSTLSIITETAERNADEPRYLALPADGSHGLLLNNSLSLYGSQGRPMSGSNVLRSTSSLGNWTQTATLLLSRSGEGEKKLRHNLQELYGQRELSGHFARFGYFMPESQGLSRQPRTLGASPDSLIGVMYGSSDSLAIDSPQPSVYPIYVTANRQASAEIYRNGVLISTQAIAPGLQTLDTRRLPGGIYDVEVRIIEDGQLVSTTQELVYKPNNWRNPEERWRYNLYAGQEADLLSNWDEPRERSLSAGAAVNYLMHPRLVTGLSVRQVQEKIQYGTSADWLIGDKSSFYASLYHTDGQGTGVDLYNNINFDYLTLGISHNRSWLDTRKTYRQLADGTRERERERTSYNGQTSNTAVTANYRLSNTTTLSGRINHAKGPRNGTGLDLSWSRRSQLFGSDANWGVTLFERPGSNTGSGRDRGIDLRLSVALGSPGQNLYGSIGRRSARDGGSETNTSLNYSRSLEGHFLQNVSLGANKDSYGTGLNGQTSFAGRHLNGSGYLQRSSYNGELSGGLNLDSSLAVGAGKFVLSSKADSASTAGMIIDVESDIEQIALRADDLGGYSAILHPGRNFLPVNAYQKNSINFNLAEGSADAAGTIEPKRADYHLNKGGVVYQRILVIKTVTVLGRLIDPQGRPLKGHHIINQASRGMSEVDGFFSLEMRASAPTLEVSYHNQLRCQFRLDPASHRLEGDVLMVGDLLCDPKKLTAVTPQSPLAG
ncbi:TcfC E-set like domain-containing protein [Pseudomonas sp. SL4(2022)]|nr:TcfC E-set like domain-containing protein [Pseudomonas sp. SL4(2022)]WAC46445.1 TcfC E-set like domain-containing protein [Pseudomonas sp. SL4(2022)]